MRVNAWLFLQLASSAVCGLGGCAETATQPTAVDTRPPEGAVRFETIAGGGDSGYARGADSQELAEPTLLGISDELTWSRFWTRHSWPVFPPAAAPMVDFSKQTVLVLVSGRYPTLTGLEITAVGSKNGVLTVRANRLCTPWLMESWPFHIVRVDGAGWSSQELQITERGCLPAN